MHVIMHSLWSVYDRDVKELKRTNKNMEYWKTLHFDAIIFDLHTFDITFQAKFSRIKIIYRQTCKIAFI